MPASVNFRATARQRAGSNPACATKASIAFLVVVILFPLEIDECDDQKNEGGLELLRSRAPALKTGHMERAGWVLLVLHPNSAMGGEQPRAATHLQGW
ncbi:hypothetical protein CN135_11015 [Sinorhizobium meliloti]|nr:hypothetical protein [Sinorhizobium meliloti]RVL80578.1 hypothetical protein CN135_11015 [Sinorhizobium meliloti]